LAVKFFQKGHHLVPKDDVSRIFDGGSPLAKDNVVQGGALYDPASRIVAVAVVSLAAKIVVMLVLVVVLVLIDIDIDIYIDINVDADACVRTTRTRSIDSMIVLVFFFLQADAQLSPVVKILDLDASRFGERQQMHRYPVPLELVPVFHFAPDVGLYPEQIGLREIGDELEDVEGSKGGRVRKAVVDGHHPCRHGGNGLLGDGVQGGGKERRLFGTAAASLPHGRVQHQDGAYSLRFDRVACGSVSDVKV